MPEFSWEGSNLQTTLILLQKLRIIEQERDLLQQEVQFLKVIIQRLEQQNKQFEYKETDYLAIIQSLISHQSSLLNNIMNQPNDTSQNISVGGDFNINANQSVINLRDVIGKLDYAIEQIPSRPDQKQDELKQLLQALASAIQIEASLDDEEKTEAAKQVEKIAQAAQNPNDKGLNAKAKRAVGFLETIANGLEPAGKLAKAAQKALPFITSFLA